MKSLVAALWLVGHWGLKHDRSHMIESDCSDSAEIGHKLRDGFVMPKFRTHLIKFPSCGGYVLL